MKLRGIINVMFLKFLCFFYSATLLLVLITESSFGQGKNKKPNIIILLADDMGYGDVGVYGSKKIPTPNMDQLAQEGMVFTDAHSPGATSTPTRYALLTGRYYWRSDMNVKGGYGYATPRLESEIQTLPEYLNDHGYHSAAIGKWHLGLQWGLEEGAEWAGSNGENINYHKPITNGPLEHGFDYFFGIPGSLDMPPWTFIENDRTVGVPSVDKDPRNTLQWDRGGLMTPGWKDEDVGPTLAKKAKEFIRSHQKQQSEDPFFLYYAATAPHSPCVPPDFIKGKSMAGERGDMVAEFDWAVGEIDQLLDELELKENTILIVTSDNGALTNGPPHWGDPVDREKYDVDHHGHAPNGVLRGQKADIWEGGHRVPFIIRWPGIVSEGSVNRDVISLIDFYSTFANILKGSAPREALDSYNILPTLYGEALEDRVPLIHRAPRSGLFAIRKGSWKLIEGRGSGGFTQPIEWKIQRGEAKGQLYNLDTDLSESKNLWDSHRGIVERLQDMLNEYREQNE